MIYRTPRTVSAVTPEVCRMILKYGGELRPSTRSYRAIREDIRTATQGLDVHERIIRAILLRDGGPELLAARAVAREAARPKKRPGRARDLTERERALIFARAALIVPGPNGRPLPAYTLAETGKKARPSISWAAVRDLLRYTEEGRGVLGERDRVRRAAGPGSRTKAKKEGPTFAERLARLPKWARREVARLLKEGRT